MTLNDWLLYMHWFDDLSFNHLNSFLASDDFPFTDRSWADPEAVTGGQDPP